jgi:hypothetical protein
MMAEILGFAVVDAGGALLHESNVERLEHIGPGMWQVYFTFSVANACEVASIAEFETAGFISAYGEPTIGPNEVTVYTGRFLADAQPAVDMTFQLAVFG